VAIVKEKQTESDIRVSRKCPECPLMRCRTRVGHGWFNERMGGRRSFSGKDINRVGIRFAIGGVYVPSSHRECIVYRRSIPIFQ